MYTDKDQLFFKYTGSLIDVDQELSMTICSACGGDNPQGTQYCTHCGAGLSANGPTELVPPDGYARPTGSPAADFFTVSTPPPPASPPPAAPPYQQPYQQPYPPPAYGQPMRKERSLAFILEIGLGIFGLFGIGRLYLGDNTTGLIWLIGGIVWDFVAVLIAAFSLGFGCLCTIPVNLVAVGIASYLLNQYIQQNPQLVS
jgi:hypothetical protein